MEDFNLNLNPNPDNKPKGKLKFKSSSAEPAPEGSPVGSGTITDPVMGSGTFNDAPAETAPTGGTIFRPKNMPENNYPAGNNTFPPGNNGFPPGNTYNPGGHFGGAPRFGDDEEYSDTAKYKGSNEGGYDYGYSKKPAPRDNYANRNVQFADPYGAPGGGRYGGPNQGPYGGPNQGPYGGPNPGPYGGPNPGPYGAPNQGPYGGPGNAQYDPVRERMLRERYQEPVQQHYLEDGNDARSALFMGIISMIAGTVVGAIGMIGGLYCTFIVFILPIFGIVKAAGVIKRDKKLALAYVALGLNCMALTPALIAILVLILYGIASAIR